MISKDNWHKYIDKLAAIDKRAADLMQKWIDENGLQDGEAAIQYAYALATKYGEASATLSCEMYDYMAEIMDTDVPEAIPAETATLKEVAKSTTWGKYHSPSQIPSAVGRHVRQAGADTMIQNAKRDKAEWAWVPQGDTCAFCITLASRGWQDATKTVLKGNHAEHIHQNCDCTFAIAFKEKDKRQYDYIYDPKKYEDMYYGADGFTSDGRINALRRDIYQQNKDQINAQKRDAYAAKRINEYTNGIVNTQIKNELLGSLRTAYYGLPPSMQNLPMIKGNPKLNDLIDVINPYNDTKNCVSCSTALALRLQGIDAISIRYSDSLEKIVTYPWNLWNLSEEPKLVIYSELKNSIERDMREWGNGAICQIPIVLNIEGRNYGHMITAFQYKNETLYFDPQRKQLNASHLFELLEPYNKESNTLAGYYYYRVDGVELSQIGKEMVKFNDDHI